MAGSVSAAALGYEDNAIHAVSLLASNSSKAQLKADDCGRTDSMLDGVIGAVALESGA